MTTQMETRHQNANLENVKQRSAVLPSVDVYENTDEILLLIDLPGVAEGDLQIGLDKDQINIEARRASVSGNTPYSREFRAEDFRRSFSMPPGVDREKVDAELRAGVLRLRLPKSANARPRQIPIRSA